MHSYNTVHMYMMCYMCVKGGEGEWGEGACEDQSSLLTKGGVAQKASCGQSLDTQDRYSGIRHLR